MKFEKWWARFGLFFFAVVSLAYLSVIGFILSENLSLVYLYSFLSNLQFLVFVSCGGLFFASVVASARDFVKSHGSKVLKNRFEDLLGSCDGEGGENTIEN